MPAVLFDFDGTLADTLPLILGSSRIACENLNIPYNESEINSYIGLPLIKTGELLLGEGKGELYYRTYQEAYHHLPKEAFTLFPGIREMLSDLKEKSVPMAIVTSKSKRGACHSLSNLDIESFFSIIVTVDDECGHKPDPGPALFALNKLGINTPVGSFFVGDSLFDILCGKAAGLTTCAVTWGAMDKESLLEINPDFLLDNPKDLQKLLNEHF